MNITWWWQKSKLVNKPTETELKLWATSEWIEYQAWIFHHSFLTLHGWQQLRNEALSWQDRPFFSIITPVFNTNPSYLRECIYSLQTQAYLHWEMCLVDDGSQNVETLNCLQNLVASDSRLRLHHFQNNQGICKATNKAIEMANGDYIAFLDHDDRLAPNALYAVANAIRKQQQTDILYSDRDLISPKGLRFMHLFKPGWSPETLYSTNYSCHFTVYKRDLIEQIGPLDDETEGSQDHDLILRATQFNPKVQHIPQVLYHWRQHEQSVALQHDAKTYAYEAAMKSIRKNLKQSHIQGTVEEIPSLWRGNYRVRLKSVPEEQYTILTLSSFEDYANQVNQKFEQNQNADYLMILSSNIQEIENQAIAELVSWLQIEKVGIVTGKIIDKQGNILHAGLVQRPTGIPLAIYAGFPEDTPGYMAMTKIVRNVSSPHPACCVLKRSLWQDLNGLNTDYTGPHALLDFALRSLNIGKRIVYNPFACFTAIDLELDWPDEQYFAQQWASWLEQGDPYYNPYLTLKLNDMGLEIS
ncbi:glycosyltransferase [Candidatus Halobeggiatoa sp. HSG11]|nr:glycosyltransferase [Candidatus Halobeggiatoa sp. HSG11]